MKLYARPKLRNASCLPLVIDDMKKKESVPLSKKEPTAPKAKWSSRQVDQPNRIANFWIGMRRELPNKFI